MWKVFDELLNLDFIRERFPHQSIFVAIKKVNNRLVQASMNLEQDNRV